MNKPMNELWQAQQDAAARFADSWRTMLQPAADPATRSPVAAEVDDRPAETVDIDTEDTSDGDSAREVAEPEPAAMNVFQAIQALGDGQREFADQMTRWAELQRELADTLTAWANQQREYADTLNHMLAPSSSRTGG